MKRLAAALIFLLSAFLASDLQAGNSNSFFMGNDASITAAAHPALVSDSEAIWYNPAGLGGNDLTRLSLSASAFMLRLQKIDKGMQVNLPSGTVQDNLSGNEYLFVPTALTFAMQATETLSWGLGVFVPQYQDITYSDDFQSNENFPGIAEPLTYDQGFDADLLDAQYHIGGALGWQANSKLKIGFAIFGVYERARMNANEFESIESADGSKTTSVFFQANARELISTLGLRATGGLQWEVVPDWKIGLVAFSPTFQMVSWGDVSATVTDATNITSGVVTEQAGRVSRKIREWNGDMVQPFSAQVSVGFTQPDWWIGAAADFSLPLKEPSLLINKKWSWNAQVGSKFRLTDNIYMGAGLFTDNTDNRDPTSLGDSAINYYGVAFGAQFDTKIKRGSGAPVTFSTTLGGRYAIGIGDVGGAVVDPAVDNILANAHEVNRSAIFNELSLQVGTAFLF